MFLALMIAYCTAFIQSPHYTVTDKVGEFVEIVNTQYDASSNQTYGVIAVYEKDTTDQGPYLDWMQPRPFPGKPSLQDMLKSIDHDNGITVVGLNQ